MFSLLQKLFVKWKCSSPPESKTGAVAQAPLMKVPLGVSGLPLRRPADVGGSGWIGEMFVAVCVCIVYVLFPKNAAKHRGFLPGKIF